MSETFDHAQEPHSPLFPVGYSLLSMQALLSEVLPAYDIGPLLDCQVLAHGINDTYLVRTMHERYIFRIYQAPRAQGRSWRSTSEILYEIDVLLHLHRKGIPVATPLPRRDGTFLCALNAPEGKRPAVLSTYAPGTYVGPSRQNPLLSARYGQAVAEIHTATDDFTSAYVGIPFDFAFFLEIPLQTIQPFLTQRHDDWLYLVRLAELLKERIGSLPSQELDVGVCHGDAQGGNANMTTENVLTFFDFEFCGRNWRAYDMACFYWGAALGKSRLGKSDAEIEELWTAYLEGYLQRRQLSASNLQAIPLFVALRHFWFLGIYTANWDYWGCGAVDDSFFDRELTFLREWVTQKIEKVF